MPADLTGPGFRLHHPHRGWLQAEGLSWGLRNCTWQDAHVFPSRRLAESVADVLRERWAETPAMDLLAVVGPNRDARAWSVSRWPSCAKGLRTGRCGLDEGHRGRCSSAVFYCDGCGLYRRGSGPAEVLLDGNREPDVGLCWFCVHVAGPDAERRAWESTHTDHFRRWGY